MSTIGIDIGGTNMRAVRFEAGEVVARVTTESPGEPGALATAAAATASSLWSDDVTAVGVGIAGLVRWPDGIFVWGPHVAGTELPVRAELEEALGTAVIVDNDANAAAWGELHAGVAVGYSDALVVTLGTGIGGAIVIDGRVYRGGSFAGEWGHMQYDPQGVLCDCGKRGCWETVASGPALVRLARAFVAQNPESALAHRLAAGELTGEAITAAADGGDETARGLVTQVGVEFGRGLCSLIAIFDPEVVIVGGGLGSVGESIIGPARRVAADALHGAAYRLVPPILVAGLGPEASAIGAAMLADELLAADVDSI